ncbi:MAG: non-ribosomal peptide synthetase [Candidatus Latescibacterota bacterium]
MLRQPATTIPELLAAQAARQGSATALLAPGRAALSYAQLRAQVEGAAGALVAGGLGPHDRIALVLPDGPELAVAFLAAASVGVAAPLNPGYQTSDFEFYLGDLGARAVLVPAGADSPARAAARARGLPVWELTAGLEGAAGTFALTTGGLPDPAGARSPAVPPSPASTGLMLHTSGTTSRPKGVPLSHANLLVSAANVAAALSLGTADRCLSVMPLFHIHGLVAGLLAVLASGGSTICAPRFAPEGFFAWIEDLAPTWYTAVPTMHQALLALAAADAQATQVARRAGLRFARSASSALAPQTLSALEQLWQAPVVEAYGMTEAAHQIASNPLPPRVRKPGSVGLPAGPEVTVLGPDGEEVPVGQSGEIAIRGPNVMAGYAGNPAASTAAFTGGWFRTGDQGYLDAEDYLFITGRLKEIINRGGEKVAPREIDEVLLAHPDVRQAVAFAVPHPSLGEDVAAAVVPEDGCQPGEAELRQFAFGRLPAFKVPSRILVVPQIPRGPTGKVQRIGLAARLSEQLHTPYEPPCGEGEALVARLFGEVLQRPRVGRDDNFFALGGDSIRAMQVLARLGAALGLQVPVTEVFHHPTPALLARAVAELSAEPEIEALALELEKLPAEERARLLDQLGEEE